jgi:hypothetical protein
MAAVIRLSRMSATRRPSAYAAEATTPGLLVGWAGTSFSEFVMTHQRPEQPSGARARDRRLVGWTKPQSIFDGSYQVPATGEAQSSHRVRNRVSLRFRNVQFDEDCCLRA